MVIQEWWGFTTHIKDVTERFAAEGFVALAPDLFGGATTHDSDEAGELMSELPVGKAAQDPGARPLRRAGRFTTPDAARDLAERIRAEPGRGRSR